MAALIASESWWVENLAYPGLVSPWAPAPASTTLQPSDVPNTPRSQSLQVSPGPVPADPIVQIPPGGGQDYPGLAGGMRTIRPAAQAPSGDRVFAKATIPMGARTVYQVEVALVAFLLLMAALLVARRHGRLGRTEVAG